MQEVALRPFDPASDESRLRHWLCQPHVARWWGEPEERLADALQHPPECHAVITIDEIPVGYVCWQRLGPDEIEAAGLPALPDGLVDIDMYLGEPEWMGQGIAPQVGRLLLAYLRADPRVSFVGTGTSASNERAIRAAEKLGFWLFQEYQEPELGPCRYMILEMNSPLRGV